MRTAAGNQEDDRNGIRDCIGRRQFTTQAARATVERIDDRAYIGQRRQHHIVAITASVSHQILIVPIVKDVTFGNPVEGPNDGVCTVVLDDDELGALSD